MRVVHKVPQRAGGHADLECPGYRLRRVRYEPDRPVALSQARNPFLVLALDLPQELGRVVTDLIVDPLVVLAAQQDQVVVRIVVGKVRRSRSSRRPGNDVGLLTKDRRIVGVGALRD